MSKEVYTIGHSNTSSLEFIGLLNKNHIEVLLDIRSKPYSNFVPHFNREYIKDELNNNAIQYIYEGNLLGGKPNDISVYRNGKVDYDVLKEREYFKEGIDRVVDFAKYNKVCLMCSEGNPLGCHRHLLLTSVLIDKGLNVLHILQNGKLLEPEIFTIKTEQLTLL